MGGHGGSRGVLGTASPPRSPPRRTLGWALTRQLSQTLTRCSKQKSVVTRRLGHLHRPMAGLGGRGGRR